MKLGNFVALAFLGTATAGLSGCVTPMVLMIRSQPASAVYETNATVTSVERAAGKIALELEAADMAALSGKAFAYSFSARSGPRQGKTLVNVDVKYVGTWTRTGFITPNEKLDLFVQDLAVRTGEAFTPFVAPAG